MATTRPDLEALEALRRDTEDLPEGPDKTEALAALADLRRIQQETSEYERFFEAEKARERRWNLVLKAVALPAGIVLAWLAIGAALDARREGVGDAILNLVLFGLPSLFLLAYVIGVLPKVPIWMIHSRTPPGFPPAGGGYVAAPKSKLILLGVLTVLAAPALAFIAFEMIDAGRMVEDNLVYTLAANPVLFWWKVAPFVLGALFFAFGAVFCVMALVRYPDPPFRRMQAARVDASGPDPLQEANAYASYGRNADAIKVLAEACAAHPERRDLATRLTELKRRLK